MNEHIELIGYGETTELAQILWVENDVTVHRTLCYTEEEVIRIYHYHLMPGSIYSKWQPQIILRSGALSVQQKKTA